MKWVKSHKETNKNEEAIFEVNQVATDQLEQKEWEDKLTKFLIVWNKMYEKLLDLEKERNTWLREDDCPASCTRS